MTGHAGLPAEARASTGAHSFLLPSSPPTALSSVLQPVAEFLVGPDYWDERVQSWPLADAQSAILVTAAYVLGVPLGQWLMRNRKPYSMKTVSVLHNIFMFVLSLWMTYETLTQAYANNGWNKNFKLWANMTEKGPGFSPSGARLANVIWIHYLSKAYEFMDTAIMVLRRKDKQVSFLHVYHHASTFGSWWVGLNFAPGGDVYFLCALNSFVHVCMYAYYLASSMGVRVPQRVKKSITLLQMSQFALLNIQAFYGVFWATWYRPRIVEALAIVQSIVFMILFGHFYRQAYGKKVRAQKAAAGARVEAAAKAAALSADQASGRPALAVNGLSAPIERKPHVSVLANGFH